MFNTRVNLSLRAAKAFQAFLLAKGVGSYRAALWSMLFMRFVYDLPQYVLLGVVLRNASLQRKFFVTLFAGAFDQFVLTDREALQDALMTLIPEARCQPFSTTECEGSPFTGEPCNEEPVFVSADWLDAAMIGSEIN